MSGKPTEVNIADLPMPQLSQLSQQLEQEIEFIQNSLGQLKTVQQKFVESRESLDKVAPENVGKDILVPLTGSMYVAGQLANADNVLVDVGTGYYVEKSTPDAKVYFKRKIEYLTKQIEKIQPQLQEKYKMKQAVMEILQLRVQAQIAAQQQTTQSKS